MMMRRNFGLSGIILKALIKNIKTLLKFESADADEGVEVAWLFEPFVLDWLLGEGFDLFDGGRVVDGVGRCWVSSY